MADTHNVVWIDPSVSNIYNLKIRKQNTVTVKYELLYLKEEEN
jgi:hypothetical protein